MYLNVRQPPLRSRFYFKPFSFLFSRQEVEHSPRPSKKGRTISDSAPTSRAPSPSRTFRAQGSGSKLTSIPISPIPPSSNPRGELIFSSRVDRTFRESYERYRTAFEKRRAEVQRNEGASWIWRWIIFWRKRPDLVTHTRATSFTSNSARGRTSRGGTPPTSAGGTLMMQQRSQSPTRVSTTAGATRTPPPNSLAQSKLRDVVT
jgi:hypothetical protein